MRATFAVMEMHMQASTSRRFDRLVAPSKRPWLKARQQAPSLRDSLEESLLARGMSPWNTPRAVALRQLPDALAEYEADNLHG